MSGELSVIFMSINGGTKINLRNIISLIYLHDLNHKKQTLYNIK